MSVVLLLVALCSATAAWAAQEAAESSSPVLAFYDFEAPVETGPDTLWVRQRRGAAVSLSEAFRWSGERSLHVTEVAGNRDFAEFLAYFPLRDEGDVFVQFYLLLTDADQRFNFGLAGDRWFLNQEMHGQAVWLQTADGVIRHHPHSGWQPLFAPRLFTWYFVDVVYHVQRGTYDLRITEEGANEPAVNRFEVTSYNARAGSAVRYFSLIGDLEDEGHFDFFVDDLLIASDPSVLQQPFVAPGRRRYFVEMLAAPPHSAARSHERAEDLLWRARRAIDLLEQLSAAREPGREIEEEADPGALELEFAADLAFRAHDLELADRIYRWLEQRPQDATRMLLKRADVQHRLGNLEQERRLRESIYGRLSYEE